MCIWTCVRESPKGGDLTIYDRRKVERVYVVQMRILVGCR